MNLQIAESILGPRPDFTDRIAQIQAQLLDLAGPGGIDDALAGRQDGKADKQPVDKPQGSGDGFRSATEPSGSVCSSADANAGADATDVVGSSGGTVLGESGTATTAPLLRPGLVNEQLRALLEPGAPPSSFPLVGAAGVQEDPLASLTSSTSASSTSATGATAPSPFSTQLPEWKFSEGSSTEISRESLQSMGSGSSAREAPDNVAKVAKLAGLLNLKSMQGSGAVEPLEAATRQIASATLGVKAKLGGAPMPEDRQQFLQNEMLQRVMAHQPNVEVKSVEPKLPVEGAGSLGTAAEPRLKEEEKKKPRAEPAKASAPVPAFRNQYVMQKLGTPRPQSQTARSSKRAGDFEDDPLGCDFQFPLQQAEPSEADAKAAAAAAAAAASSAAKAAAEAMIMSLKEKEDAPLSPELDDPLDNSRDASRSRERSVVHDVVIRLRSRSRKRRKKSPAEKSEHVEKDKEKKKKKEKRRRTPSSSRSRSMPVRMSPRRSRRPGANWDVADPKAIQAVPQLMLTNAPSIPGEPVLVQGDTGDQLMLFDSASRALVPVAAMPNIALVPDSSKPTGVLPGVSKPVQPPPPGARPRPGSQGKVCSGFILGMCFEQGCTLRHPDTPEEMREVKAKFASMPCRYGKGCRNVICPYRH
eukprot:TRINITY_DN21814_c0_g1_i2.p1 TRINITY_DN21814_c0_g1~~TRINITY_DN21814_c0_g1_i2.p1  ORF type:complete len:643 (+),score=125.73 TRINITY_DN21814_c0_g1_i2:84-2012(+)